MDFLGKPGKPRTLLLLPPIQIAAQMRRLFCWERNEVLYDTRWLRR
nr:MAG TPA: hypothetical protein [Caudoviricetes sp.]